MRTYFLVETQGEAGSADLRRQSEHPDLRDAQDTAEMVAGKVWYVTEMEHPRGGRMRLMTDTE